MENLTDEEILALTTKVKELDQIVLSLRQKNIKISSVVFFDFSLTEIHFGDKTILPNMRHSAIYKNGDDKKFTAFKGIYNGVEFANILYEGDPGFPNEV